MLAKLRCARGNSAQISALTDAMSPAQREAVKAHADRLAEAEKTVAAWREHNRYARRTWDLVHEIRPRLHALDSVVAGYQQVTGAIEVPGDQVEEVERFREAVYAFRDALKRFSGGAGVVAPVPVTDLEPEALQFVAGLEQAFQISRAEAEELSGVSPGYTRSATRALNKRKADGEGCILCGRYETDVQKLDRWKTSDGSLTCPDCQHVYRPLE